MLKAVIFDMDGVIIDSEPMHARAAVLALEKYNISITPDYIQNFIGSTTQHMCSKMVEDFHLAVTPGELLAANDEMKAYLLKKEGHTVIPYIINLIKDLHNNGLKLSIASSSPAYAIEEVLETLELKPYFDGYVSGSMVRYPKPEPDIFLLAADKLGVKPSECVVIEDSSHGITAAKKAGITSIGFINPNSGNQDLGKASMLVEGFEEINFHFIEKVYRRAHMEPLTILTTRNFVIREMTVGDIDDLYQIMRNPEINKYLDDLVDDLETAKEKQLAYIRNIYNFYDFGIWGVFFKDNGCLAGRCGIELKLLDDEEIYEIGYMLDIPYQGQGYARELVIEVIKYCFKELNIRRLVAVIDLNNERSIRLAERAGMIKYGECIRNNRYCSKYEITSIS